MFLHPIQSPLRSLSSSHLFHLYPNSFQAYFFRAKLPITDYINDTKTVLDQAPRVLNALLDMAVEEGHLDVVLALTILSKMIIQVNILVIILLLFLCLFLSLSSPPSTYSPVPLCLSSDLKVKFAFNVAVSL